MTSPVRGAAAGIPEDELPDCVICHEKLYANRFQELACTHKYHMECISQWFQRHLTCPLCRQVDVVAVAPSLDESLQRSTANISRAALIIQHMHNMREGQQAVLSQTLRLIQLMERAPTEDIAREILGIQVVVLGQAQLLLQMDQLFTDALRAEISREGR